MRRSPSFPRALLLWLALSAMVYRGLIPAGFMPVFAGGGGVGLALCSGGTLVRSDQGKDGGQAAIMEQCAYAAAGVAVVPAAAPAQVPVRCVAQPVRVASTSAPRLAPSRAQPPVRGPPATV